MLNVAQGLRYSFSLSSICSLIVIFYFLSSFVSFFLVIFVSILFAILLWYSNNLSEILEPYLVVLNSLPKSALAPLLIVWRGATKTTIIVTGIE